MKYLIDIGISVAGFLITGFLMVHAINLLGPRECGSAPTATDLIPVAAFILGIFITLQIRRAVDGLRFSSRREEDIPF